MAYNKTIKYEDLISEENIKKFKQGQSYDSYKFMG